MSLFPAVEELIATKLLFPTWYRSHYWLNVIDMESRDIEVYDPMSNYLSHKTRSAYFKGLIEALEAAVPESKNKWFYDLKDCTQKSDGHNCGIYVMSFAKDVVIGNMDNLCSFINALGLREEIGIELMSTESAGRDMLRLNNFDWTITYTSLCDHGNHGVARRVVVEACLVITIQHINSSF